MCQKADMAYPVIQRILTVTSAEGAEFLPSPFAGLACGEVVVRSAMGLEAVTHRLGIHILDTATQVSPALLPIYLGNGERDKVRRSVSFDSEPLSSGTPHPTHNPSHAFLTSASSQDDADHRLKSWLKDVGLRFDPFVPSDAGRDARLSSYLIGSRIFEDILWGDWHSLLFAPQGGGKTAFRVRLAYECRVGGDGRYIFPIPYHLTRASTAYEHYTQLGRAGATELLLELAYHPQRFEKLSENSRFQVKCVLELNAPGLLTQFIPQFREFDSSLPLVQNFDLSAAHLPGWPSRRRVRAFADALEELPPAPRSKLSPSQCFDRLLEVIRQELEYEAVYILVDGVDDSPEAIDEPIPVIEWLDVVVSTVRERERNSVFLKAFLPDSLSGRIGETQLGELIRKVKTANISWTTRQLIEMLRVRIRAASGGDFDSLDAISNLRLRNLERTLVKKAGPLPREVLALAHDLLRAHVRRSAKPTEILQREDLETALREFNPNLYRPTASL